MSAAPPPATLDPAVRQAFLDAEGFMPPQEGFALHAAAARAARLGPILEIGSFMGRSTILLAAAAAGAGTHVVSIDHHRGSEEHQPGWEYHDPSLVDPDTGTVDTLPGFRRTIALSGMEPHVIAVVGRSTDVAAYWRHPCGLVFIDGSHTEESAQGDVDAWAPHVAPGGILAIHDVFPDPADGGQAPYRAYRAALDRGAFTEVAGCGSLRLLQRGAEDR